LKEKIYTIPINDAIAENSFCPFCSIYKKIEQESISYTLGAAMMEPDFRIFTNENGFCQKHMRDLHAENKALPLSLVLKTHLDSISELFEKNLKSSKRKLFKTSNEKREFAQKLKNISDSCAICARIEKDFSRYFDTFIYMLKTEKDFLDRILKIDGFCMEHFARLSLVAVSELSDSDFEKLFIPIIELQKSRLNAHREHIKNFANSFNYCSAGKKTEAPKDIIYKTGELLNGEFAPKEKKNL